MDNLLNASPARPLTLAIASSFTAGSIEQPLTFWLEQLNLPGSIAFAPYNQVFQELLNPSSLLSGNRHGVNILLIRLEDWMVAESASSGHEHSRRADLTNKVDDFCAALMDAVRESTIPWLVVFCPASCQATSESECGRFLTGMEESARAILAAVSASRIITSAELLHAYPVETFHDPRTDEIAHVPYTRALFTALATMIARQVYGLSRPAYKAVVVNCDNTLWTGVCSEDGYLGVAIDPARQAIQDFLVTLHDKGVLVCLCSRSDAADVHRVFDARPEMRLGQRHVVSYRCNWTPTSDNLLSLAAELQLAPDAFAFLDDDPVECAEVQANCPRALVIRLPRDIETIPTFLRNLWMFDAWKTTDEARQRTGFYKQDVARNRVLQKSPSLADFLTELDVKIDITELDPHHVARASELTYRTNRFNLSTIRRSEAEVASLRHSGAESLVVRVRDRFGDYGIVGFLVFSVVSEALVIDTFLLSCRALGRGVEHQMLARVGEIARERGLRCVDVSVVSSGRNQAVVDFLRDVAEACEERQASGSSFRIPSEDAALARHRPRERSPADRRHEPAGRDSGPDSMTTDTRATSALLVAIARDLSDPTAVGEQIDTRKKARPGTTTEYVAPRTSAERTIVAIVGDVLGLDRVGVEDNFFDIGGHSLGAMQVLFRIREAFHVELSARLLYTSALTAADLATKVVDAQLSAMDPEQLASLMQRLNELSDEQVRTLLDQKRRGGAPELRDS
jgi:FkbH-like protein